MSGIEEREKGWEKKIEHDAEFRFKVEMKRNKMLGRWAAEQLGLAGEAVDTYVQAVIKADFEEAGDDDVVRKIRGDFDANGIDIDDAAIQAKIDAFNHDAARQLMAGN